MIIGAIVALGILGGGMIWFGRGNRTPNVQAMAQQLAAKFEAEITAKMLFLEDIDRRLKLLEKLKEAAGAGPASPPKE